MTDEQMGTAAKEVLDRAQAALRSGWRPRTIEKKAQPEVASCAWSGEVLTTRVREVTEHVQLYCEDGSEISITRVGPP